MAVVEVTIQKPPYDEDGYWWETVLLFVADDPISAWAMDSEDVEEWVATDPPTAFEILDEIYMGGE